MQRVFECGLVIFCGAAARLWRAAALCWAGGQPTGLAAGQNLSPFTWFLIANDTPFEPIVMKPLREKN